MNIEICLLTKECNWGTNGNSKQIVGRPDFKKNYIDVVNEKHKHLFMHVNLRDQFLL